MSAARIQWKFSPARVVLLYGAAVVLGMNASAWICGALAAASAILGMATAVLVSLALVIASRRRNEAPDSGLDSFE